MSAEARLEFVLAALDRAGASAGRRAWHVPGRIEVLGKHTDYAGGRSLLCATDRGFVVAAAPRADREVRILDVTRRARATFTLDPGLEVERGSWLRYPTTVARRLRRDFPGLGTGADLAFASDLPAAAGASSSSALVAAAFTALAAANALSERPDFRAAVPDLAALATYLGSIENGSAFGPFAADGGVGTAGGSEDSTAILFGRRGELARFSFCPLRSEGSVPMPAGTIFVVAASGVHAAKATGARERFNRLPALAAALAALWRRETGRDEATLGEIASLPGGAGELAALVARAGDSGFPRPELEARLAQFVLESENAVPGAAAALARGDLDGFAGWVELSVEHGARDLRNQVPETLALVAIARRLGAVAASPFGAGFGGSVWALVRETEAAGFGASWLREYLRQFPQREELASWFATEAAEGLRVLI